MPSLIHGAAAIPSWGTDYKDAITFFLANKDVAAAQKALIDAAKTNLATMQGQ